MSLEKATLVCADDFGYSQGVNEAIINLLRDHRIDACSIMVNGGISYEQRNYLTNSGYPLGLHLDFTHFNKVFYPNNIVLIGLLLRMKLLNCSKLRMEILNQITKFKEIFNRYPDFIDGHQHVHQFYSVYDELASLCDELDLNKYIWIRDSRDNASNLKAKVVDCLTSSRFDTLNAHYGLRTKLLTGVYNFGDIQKFRDNLDKKDRLEGAVMMVHPSVNEEDGKFRFDEYNILNNGS